MRTPSPGLRHVVAALDLAYRSTMARMLLQSFASIGKHVMARLPRARSRPTFENGVKMLWTIAVILFVLWALGLATSYTMGGLVHILLVLAVVTVVIRLIQGRKALP